MIVTSRCFWFRVFVLGRYKSTVSLACEVGCLIFFFLLPPDSFLHLHYLFIHTFVYSFSEILAPGGLILSNLTETQSVHAKSVIKLKLFNSESVWGEKSIQRKAVFGRYWHQYTGYGKEKIKLFKSYLFFQKSTLSCIYFLVINSSYIKENKKITEHLSIHTFLNHLSYVGLQESHSALVDTYFQI